MLIARMLPLALVPALCAFAAPQEAQREVEEQLHFTPALPATPAAVAEVLAIRPFTLDAPYVHAWRKERPSADAGFLLVLRVDPDLVYPRQTAQPIFMAGAQTLEVMNVGYPSGMVIAILPAPRAPDGLPRVDWAQTPFFAGTPGLPEAVDEAAAAERLAAATQAGVLPTSEASRAAALRRGGEILRLADREALDRELGKLVRRHAPDESERADALEGITDSEPRQVIVR